MMHIDFNNLITFVPGTYYLTNLLSSLEKIKKVIVLNTSRLWRADTVKVIVQKELKRQNAVVVSIEQPSYSIYYKDPNDFLVN